MSASISPCLEPKCRVARPRLQPARAPIFSKVAAAMPRSWIRAAAASNRRRRELSRRSAWVRCDVDAGRA